MDANLRFLAAVAIACGTFLSAAQKVSAVGLEFAVSESKKTGLPLLVIATGENCGHCKALKARFASEPELQQLLTQYVPLVLDVGDPDFNVWSGLYKPTGNGIPMMFIVNSKGEELYNRSGAPQGDGLKQLLLEGIDKTGGPKDLSKIYPPAQNDKRLSAAVRNAKAHLAKKSTAEAVALLLAHADKPKAADKKEPEGKLTGLAAKAKAQPEPEKTGAAKEIADLLAKLTEDAQALLDKAEKNLEVETADKQVLGATFLVEARRAYSRLPVVGDAISQKVDEVREKADGPKLLEQAAALDIARVWEAKENLRAATAAYRKVTVDYPDSAAATIAERRIEQLHAASGSNDVAKSEAPAGGGSDAAADLKKAASFLKMAKTFSTTRPEKAKDYAAKVIELAPNTPEAKEASKLLESLK